MTTNQTIDGVPRELLERCARELSIGIGPAPKNRAKELRALLDAPAALGEIDMTQKRLAHAESVIEQQQNLIASLRSELAESYRVDGKPQGDTVAIGTLHRDGDERIVFDPIGDPHIKDGMGVYAEQPVPVAVVLPERLDLPHRDEFESADQYAAAVGEAKKWNDCLDELKRLNPSL